MFSLLQIAIPLASFLPRWLGILSRVKSLFWVRQHDTLRSGKGTVREHEQASDHLLTSAMHKFLAAQSYQYVGARKIIFMER